MQLLSLLFYAIALASPSSAEHLRHLQNGNQTALFPAVYTSIIVAPGRESQPHGDEVYFAAEIDFLEIIKTGLPSPYDGSGDDFMMISFIVHDHVELNHLAKLVDVSPRSNIAAHSPSHASSMRMDESLTKELYNQIDNKEEENEDRLQEYSTIPGFSCYKNLDGSFDWIQSMVDRSSSIPNLSITTMDIGNSYKRTVNENGYDIIAMKVTGGGVSAIGRTTEKGVLFLMAGLHPREFAPPELVSRWVESMINGYGSDAEITAILDHTEIHVVLQSNPDGRNVAENNLDVFRRKNLNPSGDVFPCEQSSMGVDLNRNFPFRWGFDNTGSSSDKCSQIYRGQSPGSEPEVQAIMNYSMSIFPENQRKLNPEQQIEEPFGEDVMGIFFDVHAYSELVVWPWSYLDTETGNDIELETLVNKIKHFNGYKFAGPNNGFLYPASGVSHDWAYGFLGTAGMTFELGTTFYQDCEYFETSIVPDNFPAFTYAAKSSTAPFSIPKGPDVISASTDVNGNSLIIAAIASDSAYAAVDYPTSQQGVSVIRAFVDFHPYDKQNGQIPSGTAITGQSTTIDISDLTVGRHSIYFQAIDGDGYAGPITAVFFEKLDADAPPIATTKRPTNAPTRGPTNVPTTPPTNNTPQECSDSPSDSFRVGIINMDKDCSWLAENIGSSRRFNFLCDLLEVAATCPYTCDSCEIFSASPVSTLEPTSAPTPGPTPTSTSAPTSVLCNIFPIFCPKQQDQD